MGTWSPSAGPTSGDDIYTGDGGVDVADGGPGADTLSGHGGADTLNGGDGNDVLYGHSAGATNTIVSSAFITGLNTPVAGASTPGDPGFLYFVEKGTGIIWRVDAASGARTTFLDIPQGDFNSDGEQGVLGLAFHPDYAANGRFFVYLADAQGDIQVREYSRSANPAVANTTSTLVIEIERPGSDTNHIGGWLGFSPEDGYLYFGTGDGGGSGDPNNNSQNLNVLHGKIIRIDVDNGDAFPADPLRNYSIPADNPFVGVAGADEIWAYGLRNPWRMAFDPRNGDLYIGDVGQGAREEVDYLPDGEGGVNFGWRIMEGNLPYNPGGPGTPQPGDPSLRLPIYDYPRTVGTTVTGGEVYTGSNAGFVGQYVFADFGSGRLFTLSVVAGAAVDVTDRTSQISGPTPGGVVDFVTGTDGRLYAIGIGGTVWLLTPGVGAEDVADTLNGGAGNDRLVGGAGNDTLNGGANIDTSAYAIASSSASWQRNPNGTWTVTTGAEGVDTLTSVEFLDFTDRDVFLDRAYSTFSGDGTSDVFMRHSSGTMGAWFVNGAGVTGAAGLGSLDLAWTIEGVGDFNGDGRDDILMRHSSGAVGAWFMNGVAVSGAAGLGAIDAAWDIVGLGDLNGDGFDDIVMWNDNGSLGVWFTSNGGVSGSAGLGNVSQANWDFEALGDFNGDGRDDILWRNSAGDTGIWFMNGGAATGAAIGNIAASWAIEGAGDFNGDGRDDILMRNSNGNLGVWFMNGASATGVGFGNVDDSFAVAAIGDYNGDGRDDILWWNDNDGLGVWFMNDASATSTSYGSVSHDWVINPGG